MNFRIITKYRSSGDEAVTNTYLNIIKHAFIKIGFSFINGTDNLSKEDFLIFDECKLAFKYLLKGYKNIVIWVQGVVPEEALMQGYTKYRYWAHSFIENYVLHKAKLILFCSDSMKKHYEEKYKISFNNNYVIMPCFNETTVDEESFYCKNKYTENSFLYIGTLNVWQCFDETVELYKKIEEESQSLGINTKLYVYTPQQTEAKRIICNYHVKNYEIGYYSSNDLGAHIRNMKYGFILRKNNVVNQVATPTKLSNYVSHGIIPIYSPCLCSFDNYNRESNGPSISYSMEKPDIDPILKSMQNAIITEDIKKWCNSTFESYYSANMYINVIRQKIGEIINAKY